MNSKSLMMLGMAVAFGLVAMITANFMMAPPPEKPAEEILDVVTAARDINEEETIKADALKLIKRPKSAVPPGAFSLVNDVEGRWAKTALLEGDVLIEKKLGPKGMPPGLVSKIPEGMRAYAIDVTEQSGVSGFVLPGYHVDIIQYEQEGKSRNSDTILQDVQVLASGQVFTRAEERSVATRTVTLAVTPAQVDILVAARAMGALYLSLRGANDHKVVEKKAAVKSQAEIELEERLRNEAEQRMKLEGKLAELEKSLLKKADEPPPDPRLKAHFTTIYRGTPQINQQSGGDFHREKIPLNDEARLVVAMERSGAAGGAGMGLGMVARSPALVPGPSGPAAGDAPMFPGPPTNAPPIPLPRLPAPPANNLVSSSIGAPPPLFVPAPPMVNSPRSATTVPTPTRPVPAAPSLGELQADDLADMDGP